MIIYKKTKRKIQQLIFSFPKKHTPYRPQRNNNSQTHGAYMQHCTMFGAYLASKQTTHLSALQVSQRQWKSHSKRLLWRLSKIIHVNCLTQWQHIAGAHWSWLLWRVWAVLQKPGHRQATSSSRETAVMCWQFSQQLLGLSKKAVGERWLPQMETV